MGRPRDGRIVMKFGGTSMAGSERIRRVANIVRASRRGHEVAVVVSAMAGETDRLVGFCREANPLYDPPNTMWSSRRANR
jgi:aspartate kinase